MDYKVIINALIIILIIYLILENVNYNYKFNASNKKQNKIEENIKEYNIENERFENERFENERFENEGFENEGFENEGFKNNQSIDFLTNDDDLVPNIDTILNKKCVDTEIESDNIKPGNFWLDANNTPNFDNNVTNVSKYYDINSEEEAPPLNEITNYEENYAKKELEKTIIDKQSKQSCFLNENNQDFATINPDFWKYKDESPMNGGEISNGIVGFDTLNSDFALYDKNKINNQSCDNNINCTDDDLRNGMSTEAQQSRMNNT
jgi:hypothetical protein